MTLKDYIDLEAFKILVIFNSVYALADLISLPERCYMIYTQRKSNILLLLIIDNVLLIGLIY